MAGHCAATNDSLCGLDGPDAATPETGNGVVMIDIVGNR